MNQSQPNATIPTSSSTATKQPTTQQTKQPIAPVDIDPNIPIILFDGVCKLCNVWSKFVLRFDRKQRFKLCSVQSPSGQYLLQKFGYPTDVFDTMLLIEGDSAYEKSDSFLRIMQQMGWPWRVLLLARIIPRPIRDWLYDRIAQNRYRIFGKYEHCVVPRPEHQQRFLP